MENINFKKGKRKGLGHHSSQPRVLPGLFLSERGAGKVGKAAFPKPRNSLALKGCPRAASSHLFSEVTLFFEKIPLCYLIYWLPASF